MYQIVKKEGKYKITKDKIKLWLREQDVHTLHRDLKRKFPRRHTVVSGVDTQWGIDLASVENISKYNDGILYLMVVIDVFSKYLFIEPLKSRKAKDVVQAFDRVLTKGRSPEIVYSDKGSEFNNALFKKYLTKRHIKYFTTQNEDIKVSVAERVIRTV
ncbi:MAG: transposase family protein [Sedimenticola sp.]